jgi:hypothetical protein
MPLTAHDFDAAYGPVLAKFSAKVPAPVLKEFADETADAVQSLLMKTHDAQKAKGASPAVLAEITGDIATYKSWHSAKFP